MVLIFGIVGFLIIGFVIAGVICYYKIAIPNMRPLSEEQLSICQKVIDSGKNYPWVCKRAVKKKECPCFPCNGIREYQK